MKTALSIVMVGEVDHGKSSLVGRLLDETGAIPASKIASVKRICEEQGKEFEHAFLLDAFEEEQRQGVTIDVSHIQFSTPTRQYKLIDAPGHREFLKNMISGSSSADAAILLVDAQQGLHEQSRRHCYLLKLLGITHIVVAINKMDLMSYSQKAFDSIRIEHGKYLSELGIHQVQYIPVSARFGVNITSLKKEMPWYKGETLLQALDHLPSRAPNEEGALRFSVQDVYKFDDRRIVAGRIESGQLSVGSKLKIWPSGETTEVASLERWSAPPVSTAKAGESIGVTLSSQVFIERGNILSHAEEKMHVSSAFKVSLFWMSKNPLMLFHAYKIKILSQEIECQITQIHRVVDTSTLKGDSPTVPEVKQYEVAELTLKISRPVVVDLFSDLPHSGRFVLVDNGLVSGGGIITEIQDLGVSALAQMRPHTTREFSRVKIQDRTLRNGHRGAVIWLTGLSGSGKSQLAKTVEAELFLQGRQTFVLDGDNIRNGLSADLSFSPSDRTENIRRVGEVAKLFAEAGHIVITAFISPFEKDRAVVRKLMDTVLFYEVFLKCPLEVCEKRDSKGLYRKARSGALPEFTGISSPFEEPKSAHLIIDSASQSKDECANDLLKFIASSEIFK